jgi:ABC-2 type transport system ATP-binding protein
VREGEVVGLPGPDGAGETTAIRCIATPLPVPPGTARVFGHDADRDRVAVRRPFGCVPRQLSADAALTGRENITLVARVCDVPRRERAARVARAAAAVTIVITALLGVSPTRSPLRLLGVAAAVVLGPAPPPPAHGWAGSPAD